MYNLKNLRETNMRQFMISAAAMTAFAALQASVPANAIENYGPSKVGNQCFTPAHTQGRDFAFGTWGACPKPASVATARAASRSAKR
jgi:hypothetical protein